MSDRRSLEEIRSLLDKFTIPQLRELAHALSVDIAGSQGKSKEGLLQKLLAYGDSEKVALGAHRLEALLPFKHVFIFSLGNHFPTTYSSEELRGTLERTYPELITGFSSGAQRSQELRPQVCVIDKTNQRFYLKLVHSVYSEEWVRTTDTRKELKKYWRRHPVVITLRPVEALATIGFPGFTQGSGTPLGSRLNYPAIAQNARRLFTETSGLEVTGLPIKNAIESLIKEYPNEVTDIKRRVPHQGGRLSVDVGPGRENVAVFLSQLLNEVGEMEITKDEVRDFFAKGEADDIYLFWTQLRILTRVSFHEVAPELLFVWRAGGRDISHIDHVLFRIAHFAKKSTFALFSEAAAFVGRLDAGQLVRPSTLIQRFNLTYEDSMEVLREAMEKQLIVMRFRVNTDATLKEIDNEWRAAIAEFPKQVTDIDGNPISLEDPANIEIAFQRV